MVMVCSCVDKLTKAVNLLPLYPVWYCNVCACLCLCLCVCACMHASLFQLQGAMHILNLLPITLLLGWSHLLATTLHVEDSNSLLERARETEYSFFV